MKDEDIVTGDNFKKWFGKSLLVDDDNKPLILYHGSTSHFYRFDINKANHESFAGRGFYFSSCKSDATHNYGSLDGPDLVSKKELFIENIELICENLSNLDDTQIIESRISQDNFIDFIIELVKGDDSYQEKIEKIHEYINEKNLIVPEESTECKKYLEKAFSKLIEQKNEGIVHSVYLKMEKPFYLDKHEWEKEFTVSNELKNFFNDFLQTYPQEKNLIEDLLYNLQYYADLDSEDYLSIDKSSLFESLDIDLSSLGDNDYEPSNYSLDTCRKISYYWDEKIGEDEYLTGNYTDNDVIQKFKSYVIENYGDSLSGRELRKLDSFFESDSEIIKANELFSKINSEFDFFSDYNNYEVTSSNVFFSFIYSLGFDGIVMNTDRFKNMKIKPDTLHYIVRESNQIKLSDGLNTEFSQYNDDIRFKKVMCKPNISISQTDAFEIIEKFHCKFPNFQYSRIFQKQTDIQNYTQTKDKVAGFYYSKNGNSFIGIILENIQSQQHLEKVLIHEHLGHASLRNILGNEFDNTMMSIFQYLKRNNAIEINENWTKKEKIEIAEEFFANSMETKNKFSTTLLSKITSVVRTIIRSIFKDFPLSSDEFSVLQEKSYMNSKKSKSNKP